jgi:hypothetical protein
MTYHPIPGVSRVIGLTGAARHGKDAAAKILLKLLPGAERFAFSDALSVECRVHHGMTKRHPALLQDVGMLFRESKPGVWLRALYGAIEDRQPEVAIITGIRFPDEAAMVREMGGTIVRVARTQKNGDPYVADDRNPYHRAEAELDAICPDANVVVRSGDLHSLEAILRDMFITQPDSVNR